MDSRISAKTQAPAGPIGFLLTAAALLVLVALASVTAWQSTSQLHTVLEAVAASAAFWVGVIALVRQQTRDDAIFAFIGAGFFGTAMLDGYHAIVTADGVSQYLPSSLPTLTAWTWLASRLFLSVCLYFSYLEWKRPRRNRPLANVVIYVAAGILILSSMVFFALAPLPSVHFPDSFLHRPVEWIPAVFFGLALVGYVSGGTWRHDRFERLLICSLLVALVSQAVVMAQSAQRFDAMFDLAHGLKIASYLLVGAGLASSVFHAYDDAQRLSWQWQRSVEDLALANEGLEAFIRTASHDLKAPLRHVFSFCGFVRREAADRLTEEEVADLGRAMDAASHMSDLLESLLRFAKLGARSLKHETFLLSEVVDTVVSRLPAERQSQVHYGRLSELNGDRALLTVVMQNLIENGLKYVRDRSAEVVIQSETNSRGAHVRVIDNGIGVSREQLERIFQPGIRGVSDSQFPGTGFGLATCARIVAAHRGKIWVEPNGDGGSTFHFTIPRRVDSAENVPGET